MAASIISVSRRTDIPHFFTPWLMQRLREGRVMVRNPRNHAHVMSVSLEPSDVVALVFWSRDYSRLLAHLPELDARGYKSLFHLTLTGYDKTLEPGAKPVDATLQQVAALARTYGPERLIWRYDPIVMSSDNGARFHREHFARLAARMAPFTKRCIVSYLDRYASAVRQLDDITSRTGETFAAPSLEQRLELAHDLAVLGRGFGIEVSACCEAELAQAVPKAKCIDAELIGAITGLPSTAFREAPTRKGCGCVFARDIGAYHTCAHGCAYCYANSSPEVARRNAKLVEVTSNHLGAGDLEPAGRLPQQDCQLGLPVIGRSGRCGDGGLESR